MYAEQNALKCYKELACDPVGGHSVWGAMGTPAIVNYSRPVVVATASFDSTAFFHDLATGAEGSISGAIALLAAADALTRADVPNMEDLDKQLVFALFDAESWGFVGSRAWVADVQEFKCDELATDKSCLNPYRPDIQVL
jgi:nicastrin